ncbi:MAG: hypothetical protein HY874_08280 [Chloroflexi bacterium]|nr:hypothetical protein [Chloroflexota bacterium]
MSAHAGAKYALVRSAAPGRLRVRTNYFEHQTAGGLMRWAGAHVRSAVAARPRAWAHVAILAITIAAAVEAVVLRG